MGGVGFCFYRGRFREGVCFTDDVYFGGCCLRGVFRVFIFRCSAYIRRLLFVFSVLPIFVRLEQGSGCLIKFVVSKKKLGPLSYLIVKIWDISDLKKCKLFET